MTAVKILGEDALVCHNNVHVHLYIHHDSCICNNIVRGTTLQLVVGIPNGEIFAKLNYAI